MQSHRLDYDITGNDIQVVEIELDEGETVIAEAGAMNWMDEGIAFETRLGDGSPSRGGVFGRLWNVGKRVITGESIFMTHFTNTQSARKRVAFAAPHPGRIVPVDLSEMGGQLLCQKDAFLCAALGTRVGIAFTKRLGAGFFGGEGFILQRLSGDGMVFIHAGGTLTQRVLIGETILVDTGCIVAFTDGITYKIKRAGGLRSMLFGGEGIFLAALSGRGTVFLQSLPFSRLADRILKSVPRTGAKDNGES